MLEEDDFLDDVLVDNVFADGETLFSGNLSKHQEVIHHRRE